MRCPRASGFEREFRSGAREAHFRVAGTVDRADPRGLRAGTGAHVARQRAAGIGLEPREERIEIAPVDALRRRASLRCRSATASAR